jgi:hypothetical protein
MVVKVSETKLTFTNEQAKQIQGIVSKDLEFKKNFTLIVNAWRMQKIGTKNAVRLVKDELRKAKKRI